MLSMGVGIAAPATALATGTEIGLALSVGALAVVAVLLRGRTLTRYHLPALLLLALALTGTVGTAVGYEQASREADRVEYSVEPCVEPGSDTAGDDRSDGVPVTTVPAERTETDFEDLSPAAREIFLRTLRTDGSYETRERPDDIDYASDTPAPNYVEYEGDCYVFVADSPFTLGLYAFFFLLTGLFSVTLLVVGGWCVAAPSFEVPVALLVGTGFGVGVAVLLWGFVPTFMHVALLFVAAVPTGGVLAVGAVRLLESRRGERFRESMKTDRRQ